MCEVGIRVITVNWKSQDIQYIPEVQTEILHSINEPTEGLYKLLCVEIKTVVCGMHQKYVDMKPSNLISFKLAPPPHTPASSCHLL
jgi:hypothetical protein